MGRSKDELEAIWNRSQVPFRFLGNMRGVVIQDDPDFDFGCIKTVERFEKINKFVTCKNCENVFEIINLHPIMIDWPYYDDYDYDDIDDD